ncbi:ATPase [Wenjunlia vitaminophila]|uniref:ATPase n=1 Tax=Wenjunlia vitaminophila TaxID=76728 RepID=A0A0T6LSR6_WENVI|nr:BadF/BadG/BcrA/BcrD ATPase family protein [Wenjunlia vitaminophila]KRV48945.1 ATPase [Wenjunlia vitaminophila]
MANSTDPRSGSADAGEALVLGGDLGGTSTRVLVADRTGRPLGRGVAGGGNPFSHPVSAAAELGRALAVALAGLDPTRVRAAVVGAAGGTALRIPEVAEPFRRAWQEAGLTVSPRYLSDLEVAFASGTPAPDGTALIVGTGTSGGVVVDHRVVRTVDGYGWLLGDDGSGFWIGREAVRATLRALDAGQRLGVLGRSVVDGLLGDRTTAGAVAAPDDPVELRDELIAAANNRPPVRLAELSRPVAAAFDAGEPAAVDIVERAAGLLADTVGLVRRGVGPDAPLVIAGSVGSAASPVGRRLKEILAGRIEGELLTAGDGVAGATWLALRDLDPALATAETHTRLAH